MKTTLHYIIAILLFSLNAAHAFAAGDEPPFTITGIGYYEYSADSKLLTIYQSDGLTIEGNEMPVDCGIKLNDGVKVTIKNLHLQTANPLTVDDRGTGISAAITLKGTNILESTGARSPGMLISLGILTISGNGSLTIIGSGAAGVLIDGGSLNVRDNAFVVAIGTGGYEAIKNGRLHHASGLLIQGSQDQSDGTISQTYSELKGDNFTLGGNAEIPKWATVTIAAGQTFVIADGITLTNKGTIVNNGTLTNNGTLNLEGRAKITGAGLIVGTGVTIGEVEVWLTTTGTISSVSHNLLQLYNKNTNTYYQQIRTGLFQVPLNVEYQVCVEKDYIGASVMPKVNNEILLIKEVYTVYFYIEGENRFSTYRVNEVPLHPYQPKNTRPNHTLRWYTDKQYTTEITDWSKMPFEYTLFYEIYIYGRWEPDPLPPPVEPDPEPEPEPTVYYTVTLPLVEGAVTDPVAGDYDIESCSTFRFYLTLDADYDESQPVVTTSLGETLQPRTSDGAYLVKNVCTDVEIIIDGIVKNPPPVANEPIRAATPEPEIWSENACLCIRLPEGMPSSPVRIFTPEGRLLDSFRSVPGLNRRQLPTGIYIVRVDKTVRKIIIR